MTTESHPSLDWSPYMARLARQEIDRVKAALGPRYDTQLTSHSIGQLAEMAASELAGGSETGGNAWRPAEPDVPGPGSLSEAIALALGDAYAGIEFEDPTFERGTDAVMQVLRERGQVRS